MSERSVSSAADKLGISEHSMSAADENGAYCEHLAIYAIRDNSVVAINNSSQDCLRRDPTTSHAKLINPAEPLDQSKSASRMSPIRSAGSDLAASSTIWNFFNTDFPSSRL
jgi:hypothetical protein